MMRRVATGLAMIASAPAAAETGEGRGERASEGVRWRTNGGCLTMIW